MSIIGSNGSIAGLSSLSSNTITGLVGGTGEHQAPQTSNSASAVPASGAASAKAGGGVALGTAADKAAGRAALRQGLLAALADIGSVLQAGMPGAGQGASRFAAGRAATLTLERTIDRYFQF